MEENMEVMPQTDAIPEGDVTESTGQPVDTTAAEGTGEPQGDAIPPQEPAQEEAQPEEIPPAPFLSVQFNHEEVSFDREEAVDRLQRGLHYEKTLEPKLRMLAAGAGKSVTELVDGLVAANDRALKERFLREASGNEDVANRLMEHEMARRQAAYDTSLKTEREQKAAEKQTLTDRLAGDFAELRAEVPELTEFKNVPQTVVEDAVKNNRTLLDAYLRYERRERAAVSRNAAAQEAAAKATAGSQADSPPAGGEDAASASVRSAIRSVFE